MKLKGLFFSFLMLSISLNLSSQTDRQRVREKLESRKVAFITERINLNTQEAQSFWPIYNELKSELKELRKDTKRSDRNMMTEEEAASSIEKMFEREQAHLEIKRKYSEKMKAVIGAKRTLRFLKLDREFKEKMIRDVKGRRGRNK